MRDIDIAEEETATTKKEWEALQMRVTLDNQLTALDDEDTIQLEAEVQAVDQQAIKESLLELVERHTTEFEYILDSQRKAAGLQDISPLVEYARFLTNG